MSLADVSRALSRHIGEDGSLDLYTTVQVEDALAPVRDVLPRFGITAPYWVSGARLPLATGAVVLEGSASFGVPGAAPANVSPVALRLTATQPSEQAPVDFELALAISRTGWTFSTTFPVLPPYQYFTGTGVGWSSDSFLKDLPLQRATFSSRSGTGPGTDAAFPLVLSGDLMPSGVLEAYADLFAPWPLRLSGTVTLPASPQESPEMDLLAVAPSLSVAVGDLSLREAGLGLHVVTGLNEEEQGVTDFSVLEIRGTLYLGTVDPVVVHLSTPLLASVSTWRLLARLDPGEATLARGLAEVAAIFGVPAEELSVPPGIDDFLGFYVSEVEVALPVPTSLASLRPPERVAVTLASDRVWNPPIPFVRVRDLGTRWVMGWLSEQAGGGAYLAGSVYGTFVVGGDAPPPAGGPVMQDGGTAPAGLEDGGTFGVAVQALLPQFVVAGQLRTDDTIPIGNAFRSFFGSPGPATPDGMAITAFRFEADPLDRTFSASATITTDWTVPLAGSVSLELVDLSFRIAVTQAEVGGGIEGTLVLHGAAPLDPPGLPDPRFTLAAEYPGSSSGEGWVFTGSMYPDSLMSLTALVVHFLGMEEAPAGVPDLSVEDLFLSFSTGTRAYALRGRVVGRWTPTLFGTPLTVTATASVDVASPDGGAPAGRLEGSFAVNRLAVMAGMDVGVPNPTYQFRVQFGELWLQATTGWRGDGQARHQVISVQLGGVTLGGILEYLVGLAAPTLGYTLDAPWDVLNRVELSRFVLTVDPTLGTVELTYRAGLDLVFARVDTVGVRYRRVDGEGAVELILTGRVLDRAYTSEKPLLWDVVRDPPPAVPGAGTGLVDIRYLALGQRVTVRGLDRLETVREVLDALRGAMQPPESNRQNPLAGPDTAVVFDPSSQWLAGLDVALLEGTVQLGLVFLDPRLYGLTVALGGERAGALAGLRFEILYRKITDTIGMFRVELRLPEAFRHIELGEVSVTLGVVVVEVYTNGNFLVDLGFPHDNDFTRAFTVEVFPFIGRGGFYFGIKDGATSTRVPAITNGTFSPVLELGVGLAVGVGKDVTVGPLSGGMFVEVEVVFQGVLAWFNPTSGGAAPALYYWAQAVAAIHGKVYGQVDFKVIKVAVTVEAYAQASVTLEAYRKTVFALSVRASASATVRILFVDVDFSYTVSLDASFTLGSDRPAPWTLAGGASPTLPSHGRAEVRPAAKREPRTTRDALATAHARETARVRRSASRSVRGDAAAVELDAGDDSLLLWSTATPVFPEGRRTAALLLLPAFSIADVPVAWDGTVPANPDPAYRAAFLLFAPSGPGSAAANLVEGFLRWSIQAVTGSAGGEGENVTAGQLLLLAREMEDARTAETAFSAAGLAAFFARSLLLQVGGDPGGTPDAQAGMAFPLPPALAWTSPQAGDRDFATFGAVGPLYEWGAGRYAATLVPLPTPPSQPPADDPAAYESFASYLFRDGCLMVARAAVQAARDALEAWTYPVTSPVTLGQIAGSFPRVSLDYPVRPGDTVDAVAEALGATAAELTSLNDGLAAALATAEAGTTVPVALGITPQVVALDNADVPLAASVGLTIGTVSYQVARSQAGEWDTLDSIAARFGLASSAALFGGTALAADDQLLLPGSTFSVPASAWTPPTGTGTTLAAGILYAHFFGWPGIPHADWYAQTVFDLNAGGVLSDADHDAPLPVGRVLVVPRALNDTGTEGRGTYTTVPGDTLMRVGAALSLTQNFATGAGPDGAWPAFRDAVAAVTGGVSVPASTVEVLPGETVALLADRTLLHAGDVSGLLGWIGGAAVLRPLAVVPVPGVSVTTVAGDTLGGIAARYGITVEALARQVEDVPGIFPVDADAPVELVVTHLPVQGTDALVAAVMAGAAPAQIAGSASRWMLSGLRLPAPADDGSGHLAATGPLTALYDLTGQQTAIPAPELDGSSGTVLDVTVTLSPSAPAAGKWVQLVSSTVENGSVVVGEPVDALDFAYTAADLAAHEPAPALSLTPQRGPSPLPLAGMTPRTYGLDHPILLQSPLPLPIPVVGGAPLAGSATLWPLPDALRARAGNGTPYEVVSAARSDPSGATETVLDATWGMLLPFGVRRLDEADGVYELRGADTVGRAVLLEAWKYLAAAPPAGTQAFLLAAPAPDAGDPTGLAVLAVDAARTFLLQANLSTETAPGVRARSTRDAAPVEPVEPTVTGRYFAPFARVEGFARLLWEGSVVGGTGYALGVRTADGGGIPATAWDADGNATLYLLLVAGEQQAVAPGGRTLLAFDNCALVGPRADLSARALAVEAADGSERVAQAVVPPGSVGFTLALPQPADAGEDETAAGRLARLFSMVTYGVRAAEGSPFSASVPGLPVTPQVDDGSGESLAESRTRERRSRATRTLALASGPAENVEGERDTPPVQPSRLWRYDQVIPVYRLGPPSVAPLVPGLPDPADDPYRGVGGASTLPAASIALGMADVLGNVTAGGDAAVSAPVGYTDPLLGVSGWPAVTPTYAVTGAGGEVTLSVTVAPQPGSVAPSPVESVASSAGRASRQSEPYARAYFQLAQPGVAASLLTTLRQDGTGSPDPLPVADVAPLWRFAAGGYLASRAAASLLPVRPAADGETSLGAVASGWGAGWAALAAANADEAVERLLGAQPLVVPAYAVFAAGDTAASLAARPRPGWPPVSGEAMLAMDENAAALPLRVGAVLAIPPATITVAAPVEPETWTAPLDAVAAGAGTTSALLAGDNATARGILTRGFIFEVDGVQVTVGVTTTGDPAVPAETFDLVRQAFAEVGVNETVANIAAINGGRAGMLASGATLASTHYVVTGDDETLAANGSGEDAETLASLNAETPDLYDAGALLYLGDFDAAATSAASEVETLREFAQRFACPVEQVLAANAATVLPAGSSLVVPGAGTIPAGGAGVRVPYTVQPGDTLAAVAARFAAPPGGEDASAELAAGNAAMPRTLQPGVPITVGSGTTTTVAGDSLAAVLARLQAEDASVTLGALVAAIETEANLLAPGALLAAPPAAIPAGEDDAPLPLSAIPALYGVEAAAFAQANAGTAGLLAPGVSLRSADGAATVTTGDHDTFNAVLGRFAAGGAQVGITEVVTANADAALLIPGALALLPPVPVTLTASLGASAGPFASPLFPLSVAVRLERPAALVSPELAGEGGGAVRCVDSPIPAPLQTQGEGEAGTLTFDAFVAQVETALPTLRLASGRVEGTDGDLWAVSFGAGGITDVTAALGVPAPGGGHWPRFLALRPLYNDLVTRRAVGIPALQADGTLGEDETPTDFQGVDVEVWARRFLADVDLFLTPPYAGAAFLTEGAQAPLEALLDAKRALGDAVARGLWPVLELDDPRADAGRAEAARLLGQELDVGLSRAYDTAAVVQYDATVSSAWTAPGSTLRPARLSGGATDAGAPGGGENAPDRRPFTLAGAKLPLDEARPFLTFLMRVSDPAHHGRVEVDLDYSVLDLEFGITEVEGVTGYEASDWIAFVPPLAGSDRPAALHTTLGSSTVPIPLRAYPALPILLGQSTAPSFAGGAPPLEDAVKWTYGLTYSHEHAEQDEVRVTATFNLAPTPRAMKLGVSLDVASALARYVAVADDLWALLAGFADPARGTPAATLANAAATFAELAADVAAAWEGHWPAMPEGEAAVEGGSPEAVAGSVASGDGAGSAEAEQVAGDAPRGVGDGVQSGPTMQSFAFRIRVSDRATDEGVMVLDELTLVADGGSPGPVGAWPAVSARAPGGETVQLVPGTPADGALVYTFPAGPDDPPVPAAEWPVLTLEWAGLPIALFQNATASVSVRRNQKLLGADGPPTADAFVYQTPVVTAADVVAPLNTWTDPIDVTGAGESVEAALQAAFATLFGGVTGQRITVGMFFGYELVPGTSLATYLPVGLYPNQVVTTTTAGEIAAALAAWRAAYRPAAERAEWALSLTAYSQLGGEGARPLLVLDRLVYRIGG